MMEIGIIIILVIALIYAGLFFWKMSMERETQQINEFLMSEEAQKSINEYNLQSNKLKAIQDYNTAADNLIEGTSKAHNLTTQKLDIISRSVPNSAILQTITYNTGVINLSAKVPTLDIASQLQMRLKETGLFQTVSLIGASSVEGGGYNCTLNGVLKVGEAE